MRISTDDLLAMFRMKFGDPASAGPVHRRWLKVGYFSPNDYYEVVLDRLVTPGCRWLDVGGGTNVVPRNPRLSQSLADRCRRLVGVDPSPNIHLNPYVHERVEAFIEDYRSDEPFDLLTVRMVAEHIAQPYVALDAMARLVRPGGKLLIYTINKYSMVSAIAWLTPFWLHHPLKELIWRGTDAKDTFPVAYLMNTRQALRGLGESHGFTEVGFDYLDDCRLFFGIPVVGRLELLTWRAFRAMGIRYPETCLLGLYERKEPRREL